MICEICGLEDEIVTYSYFRFWAGWTISVCPDDLEAVQEHFGAGYILWDHE